MPSRGSASKKSLHASEQDRPDVARRRLRWRKYQGWLDPRRLVFIDETWAKTNMTRTHGRSPRGERLLAKVPHGRWRTLTFIAALRHDRITAPIEQMFSKLKTLLRKADERSGVGTQNGPRYTLRFCRAFDGAHLAKRSERGGWRIGIGPEVIAGEIDMLPTER